MRTRSAIERTYLQGLRAISKLDGFERENRVAAAAYEGGLVAGLALEVLLDLRDLIGEHIGHLSEPAGAGKESPNA